MTNWEPKDFSQTLSDESDGLAKEALKDLLVSPLFNFQFVREEDPEHLAERDLVFFTPNGTEIWAEAERKLQNNWDERGRTNRFSTLHVPYRKSKSRADIYALFNHHLDTVAVGSMKMLKRATVKEVRCWVDGKWKDDLMYDCSQRAFRFYTTHNFGQWTEITMYGDVVNADTSSSYHYHASSQFLLGVDI